MPVSTSENSNGRDERIKTLGTKLCSLREAQNLKYEDITKAIHVRPFVLRAIEEGRVLEVADSVYARGFVKSYCEYLYADDLWEKHKDLFTPQQGDIILQTQDFPPSIGINHPMPIFRRSSMVWVYLILVFAVVAAGYLLWFQQKENKVGGFAGFVRDTIATEKKPGGGGQQSGGIASGDKVRSNNVLPVNQIAPRNGVVSGEQSILTDSSRIQDASVDLSWMDGRSAEPVAAGVQKPVDNKLFIEVIGARSRLEVLQNGRIITSRTLQHAQARSYDVTADVEVRISDPAAVRLAWRGNTYEGVGEVNSPVSFVFSPTGKMKLIKGKSQYGQ